MRHCCEFDGVDIWYIKDDEMYSNRVLYMGYCPVCKKYVAELVQKNSKTNTLNSIKKVGEKAGLMVMDLMSQKLYSRNNLNKMKFIPKPYGWRYGLNRQVADKFGNECVEQYAVDFFGNSELVKRK